MMDGWRSMAYALHVVEMEMKKKKRKEKEPYLAHGKWTYHLSV